MELIIASASVVADLQTEKFEVNGETLFGKNSLSVSIEIECVSTGNIGHYSNMKNEEIAAMIAQKLLQMTINIPDQIPAFN